jgi:hypothetical protein
MSEIASAQPDVGPPFHIGVLVAAPRIVSGIQTSYVGSFHIPGAAFPADQSWSFKRSPGASLPAPAAALGGPAQWNVREAAAACF